jgi:clan AA aspartic protease
LIKGSIVHRRPALPIILRLPHVPDLKIEAVVDTGFNGFLALPISVVSALQLPFLNYFDASLADGSRIRLTVHAALLVWDGNERDVEVLATGTEPLIGTALLYDHDIHIQLKDNGRVFVKRSSSP